ncbi:unnamed protein product [Cuscuta campestris]|uniref:Reverse transcriptase domain-containing protein n=1 Tax=Cuscuta campestris TaxID=132261 RepID=A0A484KEP7_9ASTE|nr:unnamed protein product [Cuscuta campestris]
MVKERKFNHHSLCATLGITHIAFVDDLMLFSRGDIESVTVLANALNHFSQASGLRVNPQKSSIFLAGEVKDNRQDILNLVLFPLGRLPVRYLGLPLTSQRASERDFAPLIAKVEDNIFYLQNREVWTWTPKEGDSHLFKKMSIARDLFVDKLGGPDGFHDRLQNMCENGNLNTTTVYDLLRTRNQPKPWMKFIWQTYIPPRFSFTTWLILRKRLPTKIWNGVKEWLNLDVALSTLNRAIKWLRKSHHAHSNIKKMCILATLSTVYHIWRLRNGAYFDQIAVDVHSTIQKIKLSVYKVMYRLFPNAPLRLGMGIG